MSYEIEACALALLRADPDGAVPLSRLHAALVAEAGPGVGGRTGLAERLRRRPDLFLLLEPPETPWDTDSWPADVRNRYRDAMRAAGIAAEPRVAASSPGPIDGDAGVEALVRRLTASLVDLWSTTEGDPEARAQLGAAFGRATHLAATLRRAPSAP